MNTSVQSKKSSVANASRQDVLAMALGPQSESAFVFLRVVAGLMFGFHGLQILFGVLMPPEMVPKAMTQAWFGGIIELVTGVAIAAGAFTRYAAFLASGTMAVAYIQFHWMFAFNAKFFPAANQGEMALLYCALFLYMACRGGGKWSVDSVRHPLDSRP
ncbi:MAG: DoxX family protein [Fibrobacteres bacterium]|nr:DoxX family protein [Fibrobacterota bacterium]